MADRLGMGCSLEGLCGACSVTAPGGYVEGSSVEDLANLFDFSRVLVEYWIARMRRKLNCLPQDEDSELICKDEGG